MNWKAATFDLDCTLVDRGATIAAFAGRFAAHYEECLLTEVSNVARVITAADRCGYAPRTEVCAALFHQLDWRQPVSVTLLADFWRNTFPDCAVAAAGSLELLALIRRAGGQVGLISNGNGHTQRRKLRAIGAEDAFDRIVISGEVDLRKPSAAIFNRALRQLGSQPAETWHIGDHPAYDIEGARQAGMRAIWIAGVHTWPADLANPDHIASRLLEIPEILGLDRLYDAGSAR